VGFASAEAGATADRDVTPLQDAAWPCASRGNITAG